MRHASEVVTAVDAAPLGERPLLVLPVGDALQAPLRPNGTTLAPPRAPTHGPPSAPP